MDTRNELERLDPAIRQRHSSDYWNPDQLREGPVPVVGAGNSGAEIALELAARGVVERAPGLYVVGLPFQYALSSATIGGVGRDAEYVAGAIARRGRLAHAPAEGPAGARPGGAGVDTGRPEAASR